MYPLIILGLSFLFSTQVYGHSGKYILLLPLNDIVNYTN